MSLRPDTGVQNEIIQTFFRVDIGVLIYEAMTPTLGGGGSQ